MDGLCPEGVGYPRFGIPFTSNVSEYPLGHSETLVGGLGCRRRRIDTFQFVGDSPNMPKKQVHLHDLPLLF